MNPFSSTPSPEERRTQLAIGLNAAIVAVHNEQPLILLVRPTPDGPMDQLPFGPFDPLRHRTMEAGLRAWVEEQSGLDLGFIEQLYTFGDRGRHARPGDEEPHVVSIGYLALTRDPFTARRPAIDGIAGIWRKWYDFFPWEDWRGGKPSLLEATIEPLMHGWASGEDNMNSPRPADERTARLQLAFGLDGHRWDEERVLERYELLYEAGLVHEALRDGRRIARQRAGLGPLPPLGQPLQHDHRRILATAMGRLRSKLKYRPLVFELMPPEFTLFELQKTVEAISGMHLHKQNFRRLVEKGGLVEPTGQMSTHTGGRPAVLFRFRRDVLRERPAAGLRVHRARG